jgi:hypothetical protein
MPQQAVGKRAVSWRREQRELTIPLDLSSRLPLAERRERFERLLGEALERAAADGWRPDEPVSWEALRGALRFQVGYRPGLFRSEGVGVGHGPPTSARAAGWAAPLKGQLLTTPTLISCRPGLRS